MSYLSDEVEEAIKRCFPNYRLKKEVYLSYQNEKLFFDYLIEELNVYIEVQGVQHFKYVPHFHGDPFQFYRQRVRDGLKREWAESEGHTLISIDKNTKLDDDSFINLILEGLS